MKPECALLLALSTNRIEGGDYHLVCIPEQHVGDGELCFSQQAENGTSGETGSANTNTPPTRTSA